jgi:sporulation protein YlmC with PRC-barrel domain
MTGRLTFSPLTELLGIPILDISGAPVGHVTELLVDEADGRIAYVRLRINCDNDIFDQEITVPWSAMSEINRGASVWHLCVGKSTLRNLCGPARY